jgi:hypothetical protein
MWRRSVTAPSSWVSTKDGAGEPEQGSGLGKTPTVGACADL